MIKNKIKKLVVGMMLTFAVAGAAFAAVEVNTADQAQLQTIKGLGPAKAKAIVDERTKNGKFKDAADLSRRIKGVGEKTIVRLQAQGLTIAGKGNGGSSNAGNTAGNAQHPAKQK